MCSGGKDSVATCILAKEYNIHVDAVVFSEFMFSIKDNIPAEHPIQYEWKHKVLIPRLKEMGFEVVVVSPNCDYISLFNSITRRSPVPNRNGKPRGFPIVKLCHIKNYCKTIPLDKWSKKQGEFVKFIGYAVDETERIERMKKYPNQRSLLYEYNITEKEAYNICVDNNLLSPIYKLGTRDGCWFCPNKPVKFFAQFKKNYPNYWSRLKELSLLPNQINDKFKYDLSFAQVEKQIQEINGQVNMFDLLEEEKE
jgi:3'-phosphoadenosine 5'-phosphosulfate sulfotransferase (PAPS reductase)/FAD synthetase